MAAKFAECSDELIQNLKKKSTNKNTVISTNNWLKVWKTWEKQAGYNEDIKSCQPEELNLLLQEFYATVRKQAYCQFFPEYILLTSNQMVCSCNSGLISTRKYFKDNKLSSLRSFNFMLVFNVFTRVD